VDGYGSKTEDRRNEIKCNNYKIKNLESLNTLDITRQTEGCKKELHKE
jgi:hypothetical protein